MSGIERLETTNLSLNQQLSSLQLQLEENQNRISDLKEKNKILKLSASLQGKGEDTKATKQQINELVREVDKCIALLNKVICRSMESLKIKVNVANRTYPLTINRKDEEQVRKAVKVIEERLKVYEKSFAARDTQDLLSMCLLEMAVKISTDEQKVKVDVSVEQQLQTLESLLDKSL